ncbi:hypothetical protein [Paraflavitalea speifideaquila]|uniref:hypothetical protein n=1 Tax=Paraflavitalea speifideaquila TaxID=3076558 RepID=UPI0028E7F0E0|nr:hypothetical protein [Paraflavitalea speifideiaquila]
MHDVMISVKPTTPSVKPAYMHGHATRLSAKPAGTNGLPPSSCKFPIPDACFGIPDSQEVAMCFCRPTDISNGAYTVTIKRAILTCRKSGGDKGYN